MSPDRMSRLLAHLYPAGWRARYGEELTGLILESSGRRVPWRVLLDVVRGAAREHLHTAGLGSDAAPSERMRGGALLVLTAWALFVLGGFGVEKVSEHWQDATPVASRSVPTGAFDGLVVAAALGGVLVLLGIAATLPSLVRFLAGGGWPLVRRPIVVAVASTLAVAPVTVGLGVWAHRLTTHQRNGGDLGYGIGFLVWLAVVVVCLAAWTAAAAATARHLDLPPVVLRLEALLAAAVALAMAVMTAATAVWWGAIALSAPWFLAGRPIGSSASALPPQLVVSAVLMAVATALAAAGALRARRGRLAAG